MTSEAARSGVDGFVVELSPNSDDSVEVIIEKNGQVLSPLTSSCDGYTELYFPT